MTREEIIRKIEHDNERIKIYNKVMPTVLEILKKYNNKPYGEKTRQKISNELKATCNCALYLSNDYHEDISIVPLNNEGYTNFRFSYNDFKIYVKYPKRDKIRPLSKDNKINAEFSLEDFYLADCNYYIENPVEHADKILQSFAALQEEYKKFENSLSAFNSLLPSKMEHKYINGFRNYL